MELTTSVVVGGGECRVDAFGSAADVDRARWPHYAGQSMYMSREWHLSQEGWNTFSPVYICVGREDHEAYDIVLPTYLVSDAGKARFDNAPKVLFDPTHRKRVV